MFKMNHERSKFHYTIDELIKRSNDGEEINLYPALLGICYEIGELRERVKYLDEYIDKMEGNYD